jgi:hypothetical protein
MKLSRRQFLQATMGTVAGSAFPFKKAQGAGEAERQNDKIIFVTCFGGWDPTRVLVPAFDNPLVAMEVGAEVATLGDLQFVNHPERHGVQSFFQSFAYKTAFVHGILTPSVAHMACLEYIRTGFISGHPDWPSIIAKEKFSQEAIPHLVISGNTYSADLSSLVAQTGTGGQLEALLSGELYAWSDPPLERPSRTLISAERELRKRRLERVVEFSNRDIFLETQVTMAKLPLLEETQELVDWGSDGSFINDCAVALDVLEQGISSCISIEHPSLWDSHSNNDVYQFWLWEELFIGLNSLCTELENRGMGENTTIVVMSDMGRAPQLNSDLGKDHWPYSSAMIISPKIQGSRSIGNYDENFMGTALDPISGEIFSGGEVITASNFGATILEMMSVDWRKYLPNSMSIGGLF